MKLEYCCYCQRLFLTNKGSNHFHSNIGYPTLVNMSNDDKRYSLSAFMKSHANLVQIQMKREKEGK